MARKVVTVCLEDLVTGKRPCINEREYAQLKGCSTYKFQRDRYKGTGTPYGRDSNGRIWYRAEDVLAALQSKTYRSTSEYDTSSHIERLSKARQVLIAKEQ